MKSQELERTFLVKYLPNDLNKFLSEEIYDVYVLNNSGYYNLRLRKKGEKYSITRKERVNNDDASNQIETSISLVKEEFEQLIKFSDRKLCKKRFDYIANDGKIEIDVFQRDLSGLVLADVEFENEDAKNSFVMPDFCSADVTQEEFVAGGFLFTRTYGDIEKYLRKYNYEKIVCEF